MKLNKYQKILLLLYSLTFIYFSIIHVPFKIRHDSEIIYDNLFSNKANIDFTRLFLVIIITTLISGMLFYIVRNLRLTFKIKPRPKIKRAFYILIGIVIVAVSAFLLIQKYGNSSNLNKTAKKIDSTAVAMKPDQKIQTSLPIFDTTSEISISIPPFLKNKYLYKRKIFDFSDVFDAAKQSNLEVDDYIKKAGITVVDEKGLSMLPDLLKKYKTPNGKVVEGSVLLQKYGDRFYKLLGDSTFKVYDESEQVKTVKMIFPDGSIAEVPVDAVDGAIKAGAKRVN
jgi:hypothetical protein